MDRKCNWCCSVGVSNPEKIDEKDKFILLILEKMHKLASQKKAQAGILNILAQGLLSFMREVIKEFRFLVFHFKI